MDTFNAFNPEPEAEKGRWFTGVTFTTFLIGLVVGFAAHSFFVGADGDVAVDDENAPAETADEAALGDLAAVGGSDEKKGIFNFGADKKEPVAPVSGENLLVVSNQPSGERVIISMVSVSVNGWVAVHEGREDGSLGNILGARRFDAGKYFGETVELLRGTVGGNTYFVVLHSDNGDKEFDYVSEMPVKDTAGNLISGTFIATEPFGM